MISPVEIEKLAALARIKLSDEEKAHLQKDAAAILDYIDHIKKVRVTVSADAPKKRIELPHNIMREDSGPHESGMYTEKLLSAAPAREGPYIKVKKIL